MNQPVEQIADQGAMERSRGGVPAGEAAEAELAELSGGALEASALRERELAALAAIADRFPEANLRALSTEELAERLLTEPGPTKLGQLLADLYPKVTESAELSAFLADTIELSRLTRWQAAVCIDGFSGVHSAEGIRAREAECREIGVKGAECAYRLRELARRADGIAPELVQALLEDARSARKLMVRTENAFVNAPKRFLPASAGEIEAGDVLELRDGTRMFNCGGGTFAVLNQNGRASTGQPPLADIVASGELLFVERGACTSLARGVETPLYAPYSAKEYFKAGDTLYCVESGKHEVVRAAFRQEGRLMSCRSSFGGSHRVYGPFPEDFGALAKSAYFCTEREIMDLSPAALLDRLRTLEDVRMSADIKGKLPAEKCEPHPIQTMVEESMRELEVLAADFLSQRAGQWIQWRQRAPGFTSQEISEELNSLLEELQILKESRLALGSLVSALSDYSMIGADDIKDLAPKDVLPHGAYGPYYNWRKIETIHHLRQLVKSLELDTFRRNQLGEEEAADVASCYEGAIRILNRVEKVFETLERAEKDWEERERHLSDRGYKLERYGFVRWEGLPFAIPYDELRELAATVPWSRSSGEADRTGAVFHYDPRVVDRFARLPGAEVILYMERSRIAGSDGQSRFGDNARVLGAILYFPPGSIPEEAKAEAALQPFEAAFTQLMLIHPDLRGTAVGEMLLQSQAIHLQRTDAKGCFGSIPGGNYSSFGAHFKHGARLNHTDKPVARRFDGSKVPKRGFTVLVDPALRELVSQDTPLAHRERVRLLAREHEKTRPPRPS